MTRAADTAAGVTKTFSWDPLGRMTHAEVNNGGVTKSVDYANNPAGKRFMRVAGGVTKAWTYQGDNIASVESTTSPTLHSVYSGSGLGGVAERDDVDTAGGGSTTSRFYLYNHRGDVVGVSDASGNLTSAYDYDAYGSVSQSVQSGGGSAPTDDILFTGKDLDPDTGLYYFNARWYDSESGIFVSPTQLEPDREWRYVFCAGDPVDLVDTTGLEPRVVYDRGTHTMQVYLIVHVIGHGGMPVTFEFLYKTCHATNDTYTDTNPQEHSQNVDGFIPGGAGPVPYGTYNLGFAHNTRGGAQAQFSFGPRVVPIEFPIYLPTGTARGLVRIHSRGTNPATGERDDSGTHATHGCIRTQDDCTLGIMSAQGDGREGTLTVTNTVGPLAPGALY